MTLEQEYCLLRIYEFPLEQGLSAEDSKNVDQLIAQGFISWDDYIGIYTLTFEGKERLDYLHSKLCSTIKAILNIREQPIRGLSTKNIIYDE